MVANAKKSPVTKKRNAQINDKAVTEKRNTAISDGILLALASASAYFLTFTYEKSYADYFGIPSNLITVSLNTALLFFTIIVGFFGLLFIILEIMTMVFRGLNPVLLQAILPIFGSLLIVIVQIYFYGFAAWTKWLVPLFFILIIGIITFILPFFTQKGKTAFIEKLEAQQEYEQKSASFIGIMFRLLGLSPSILVILFLFGYFLANTAGTAEATKKTDFLVIHSNPEIVVLRIYGDLAIGAPFDKKTKQLEDKFIFVSIKQDSQTVFELENVGPLTRQNKQQIITTTSTPSIAAPSISQTATPTP